MNSKKETIAELEDLDLLPEIYDLRVKAWVNSKYGFLVSKDTFPDGMHDRFDQTARHWVLHDENRNLVGSGRANILSSLDELSATEAETFKRLIGSWHRNVGLISRLVIDEKFRFKGWSREFDLLRLRYLRDNGARIAIGYANPERLKRLHAYGFVDIGEITVAVDGKFKPFTYIAIMVDLNQARI